MLRHGIALVLLLIAAGSAAVGVPRVDGVVSEGEYAHMYHDEMIGMMLRWEAVEGVMYICMEAPGTGWVG